MIRSLDHRRPQGPEEAGNEIRTFQQGRDPAQVIRFSFEGEHNGVIVAGDRHLSAEGARHTARVEKPHLVDGQNAVFQDQIAGDVVDRDSKDHHPADIQVQRRIEAGP